MKSIIKFNESALMYPADSNVKMVKQFSIIFSFLFCLSINQIHLSAQPPTKKSAISLQSGLGHGESEDWVYSLFPSSDCIHTYFAGYTVYQGATPCSAPGEIQVPVVGKINVNTGELIWEVEINEGGNVYQGELINVVESGDIIIATGSYEFYNQNCMVNTDNIIVKLDKETGAIINGYPKGLKITPLDGSPDMLGGKLLSFIDENGNATGMYGSALVKNSSGDIKKAFYITDLEGNVDPSFGDNGYLFLNPNTLIRQAIKVPGNGPVKYAYIGSFYVGEVPGYENYLSDHDILVGVLDANGNRMQDWPEKIFSELDIKNLNLYVDVTLDGNGDKIDKPICEDIMEDLYENVNQEGWDIVEKNGFLYLSCQFDRFSLSGNDPNYCIDSKYDVLDLYDYMDMALIKIELCGSCSAGNKLKIDKALNIGVSDAPEFFPDLEINGDEIFILGAKTKEEGGVVKANGTIKIFNTNLDVVGEREFFTESNSSQDGWDINCSFDMVFNCDDELIIAGNDELNDEDYFFYKFSVTA